MGNELAAKLSLLYPSPGTWSLKGVRIKPASLWIDRFVGHGALSDNAFSFLRRLPSIA